MNKVRRIGAVLATTVAAAGMTSLVAASPASAVPQGPRPISNWLRAVPAHTSTWVNIYWRTSRPVCNAKVWVDAGRRVDIDYPGNRNFTSFERGNSLRPGRTDYTAIRVNPHADRQGVALLRTTITYTTCGWHSRTLADTSVVVLPVRRDNNWPGNNNGGGNGNGNHHGGGDNDHHGGGNNDHHGGGNGGGNGNDDHHGGGDNDQHHSPKVAA